jgi:hypothetical protein
VPLVWEQRIGVPARVAAVVWCSFTLFEQSSLPYHAGLEKEDGRIRE